MGDCLSFLPCIGERPQSFNGYTCEEPLTDEGQDLGAFKHIEKGVGPSGKKCVMCFAQSGQANEGLQHEAEILKVVGGHPNIIGYLDYFDAWGGGVVVKQSCLILELVEPCGNDLFEVYRSLKNASGITAMPVGQLKYYLGQVTNGVEHMYKKGIVHRDMKVENVLINGDHEVKIIDFGLAVCPTKGFTLQLATMSGMYFAPELEYGGSDWQQIKFADIWGIGAVVYTLGTHAKLQASFIKGWRRSGTFEKRVKDALKCPKDQVKDFYPILDMLLQPQPEKRASFNAIRKWVDHDGIVRNPSMRFADEVLQKWPSRKGTPACIAVELPRTWDERFNGKTIEELQLRQLDMPVILVIKRNPYETDIIGCPGRDTHLYRKDWIFFGVKGTKPSEEQKRAFKRTLGLDFSATVSMKKAKSMKVKDMAWFFPVFDALTLQSHHFNAVIGPQSKASGQNALDLRKNFNINICGLVSPDKTVKWWPDPSTKVEAGTKALILRIPNCQITDEDADVTAGDSTVPPDDLKVFMSADSFFERLATARGLTAAQTRQQWQQRAAVTTSSV